MSLETRTFPDRARFMLRLFFHLLAVGCAVLVIAAVALFPPDQYFDAATQIGGARLVLQGESPYRGAYVSPFWAAFFVLPFAALPDSLAFPLWFWATVGAWLLAGIVLVRTYRTEWSWWTSLSVAGLSLTFPPVIWSTRGQLDYLLGLGLAGFLSWAATRPLLAGASLSLLSVKPHLAILVVPLLLLWALRQRRPQVLFGFGLAVGGLLLASFFTQPEWLTAWAGALRNLPDEIRVLSPQFSPTARQFLGLWLPEKTAEFTSLAIAAAVGAAALLWAWRAPPIPDVVSLTVVGISAVFLVTPYAQGYDLSLLLVPLVALVMKALPPRAWQDWILLLGVVAVFLAPFASGILRWPQPVLFLAPLLCLVLWLSADRLPGKQHV